MFTARQPPPSQEDWSQLPDTSDLQEVWILYVSREWVRIQYWAVSLFSTDAPSFILK